MRIAQVILILLGAEFLWISYERLREEDLRDLGPAEIVGSWVGALLPPATCFMLAWGLPLWGKHNPEEQRMKRFRPSRLRAFA